MAKPTEAAALKDILVDLQSKVAKGMAALKAGLPEKAAFDAKADAVISDALNSVHPDTVKAALKADLLASLSKS